MVFKADIMAVFYPRELLREKIYLLAPFWGLFFAVNIICGSYAMSGKQIYYARTGNHFNRDLVEVFEQSKATTDVSVVVLGNSRFRNAYEYGFDPKEVATLPDGRTLTAVQFADNSAMFDYYADIGLWLLKARPDVLIIQNSVISNNLAYNSDLIDASDQVFKYYRNIVMGDNAYEDWHRVRNTLIGCPDRVYNKAQADRHMGFLRHFWHSLGDGNRSYARAQAFIANALRLGIKVVVLDLKPRVRFFETFGIEAHEVDFYGLGFYPTHEQLLPENHDKVLWWSYEEKDENNFCDYLHFNDAGRDKFTNWLSGKIVETVKK